MPSPASSQNLLDVLRKSRLVDDARLSSFLTKHPVLPAAPDKAAAKFVREGLLTEYQANQLLTGKNNAFYLLGGQYKILAVLGKGGTGTVYLAEHLAMKRQVAVKVMPQPKNANPTAVERFYREARSVAALDHPNIVRAFDVTRSADLHVLVMEYVEGKDLEQLLKANGPLPYDHAVGYAIQAAEGLQHAYERGFVHRDVKPANLLVDKHGSVKILDLGLARSYEDDGDDLTAKLGKNVVFGTADYMSPEQALGTVTLDVRTDVYSLGATLYTLVSGALPFGGSTTQKLLALQIKEPAPLRRIRPDVPEGLATVVHRMMAKDRELRYATPAQAAEALAPFARRKREAPRAGAVGGAAEIAEGLCAHPMRGAGDTEPLVPRTTPPRLPGKRRPAKRRLASRTTWAIAGVVMAALAVTTTLAIRKVTARPAPAEGDRAAAGIIRPPAISQGNPPVAAPPANPAQSVGGVLPTGADGKPLNLDFETGTLKDWSREGAAFDGQPIHGDAVARRRRGESSQHQGQYWIGGYERFGDKPQGTLTSVPFKITHPWASFLVGGGPGPNVGVELLVQPRNVVVFSAAGSEQEALRRVAVDLTKHVGAVMQIRLFDRGDGHWGHVNFDDFRFHAQRANVPTGATPAAGSGEPAVVEEVRRFDAQSESVERVAFSPDGRRFLSTGNTKSVRLWDRETGQQLRVLNGHTGTTRWAAFAADGRRAASASADGTVRLWDVVTGNELYRFDGHQGPVWGVAFSPDGRWVASGGKDQIVVVWDAQTGTERCRCTGHAGEITALTFVADGQRILSVARDATMRLWDAETGKELFRFEGHTEALVCLSVTPDGRRAVSSGYDKTVRLWDLQTGKQLLALEGHTGHVLGVAISSDGKRALSGGRDRTLRLWDLETGTATSTIDDAHGKLVTGTALTTDGRHALSCGHDGLIKLWRLPASGPVSGPQPPPATSPSPPQGSAPTAPPTVQPGGVAPAPSVPAPGLPARRIE